MGACSSAPPPWPIYRKHARETLPFTGGPRAPTSVGGGRRACGLPVAVAVKFRLLLVRLTSGTGASGPDNAVPSVYARRNCTGGSPFNGKVVQLWLQKIRRRAHGTDVKTKPDPSTACWPGWAVWHISFRLDGSRGGRGASCHVKLTNHAASCFHGGCTCLVPWHSSSCAINVCRVA